VKSYVSEKQFSNKVEIIKNEKNMKQAYSKFIAFKKCNDDEIICFLDGDDWLYDNQVLSNLRYEYCNNDIMLTYGSYYSLHKNEYKFVKAINYNQNIIKNNLFRRAKGWYCKHMRTGYAKLYKSIPEQYLKDSDNKWLSACTDLAEFYWAIEQVNGKFKVIEYPLYVYNIDASIRFDNCIYNLSKEQLAYRKKISEHIFNYISPFV
jgi:hypothetical protein